MLQCWFVGLAGDSQPIRGLERGEGRRSAPAHLTVDRPGFETAVRERLLNFCDTWPWGRPFTRIIHEPWRAFGSGQLIRGKPLRNPIAMLDQALAGLPRWHALGSEVVPSVSLHKIPSDTSTGFIDSAEGKLGFDETLLGRLAVPSHSAAMVLVDAQTEVIQEPHIELRRGVTLLCQTQKLRMRSNIVPALESSEPIRIVRARRCEKKRRDNGCSNK
jgi:hypothetical protein